MHPLTIVYIILVILVFFLYLSISIFVAEAARNHGRSGTFWFIYSLLISPLFCLLLLIALGDTEAKKKEKWLEQENLLRRILQSLGNKSSGKEEIDKEKENERLRKLLEKTRRS